jgi:Domain of unknown function (DUF5668)
MHTDTNTQPTRIPAGKLLTGIALLAVGILAFTDAIDFDYWYPRDIWRLWPVFLIVIGVGTEIDTLRNRSGDGGFVLIAIGVWMLAGSLELFGLSYRSGFPLAVAVFGLGLITHAVLGIEKAKEKEKTS